METTYSRVVGLAIPVFFILIALEFVIDLARGTRYYRLADAINSLSCGIISTGMRVFFGFLGLYAYEWVLRHCAPWRLAASQWTTWVFAFVLYDFCYYWYHRAGHTVGLFWAAHVVHHQSEEFNLTTALRQPGTSALTGWIFYVPLALGGVPLGLFLLVGLAQLFYQFWPHTRHIGRMGILDRWIQTPSNHRVHHAQNDIYLDKNYVGVFLIWDRLFGSFQEELDREPPVYGIRGQLKSWNPLWANLHYYCTMAHDSWHTRRWRDKLRIWFGPPGWHPADIARRFPKREYNPHRDFSRFDPPRNLPLTVYAFVQMTGDIYMQSDPPRMYKVLRQTKKPCFAFKVLAAGRIADRGIEQAFRTAFESIKPTDAIYVGMFPKFKDEVRENAEIVHRILTRSAAVPADGARLAMNSSRREPAC